MVNKNKKVAIALSGGVDSAVAGVLLQKQGYDLTALYLKLFTGDVGENQARIAAEFLKIPFYAIDARVDFKKKIIDYFLNEYKEGRTPNPCVKCNRDIKFGILYEKVREMGFCRLATGHYIKLKVNEKFKNFYKYKLCVAKDKGKDQSYFLYNLTQEILARVEFPLGNYTKRQVKAMAKKWELPVFESESQDICFLTNANQREWESESTRKVDHNEFLKKYLKMSKGDILTLNGEKIGEHQGLPLYTIGQRRSVGIGCSGPYYVVKKDLKKNILFVSKDRDDKMLYSKELIAIEVNWISGKEPKFPVKVEVKIRYRHEAVDAVIKENSKFKTQNSKIRNNFIIKFKEPQRAVTSGQSVVFYRKNEIIGGGIIC